MEVPVPLEGRLGLTRGFGGNWLLEPFCRGSSKAFGGFGNRL